VTLEWHPDDVIEVLRSMLDPSRRNYKHIDWPLSNYTSATYDAVTKDGETVGLSMFSGYTYNDRTMVSLAIIDPQFEVGDELLLVWGEENGGTEKTTVERHTQTEIRVKVSLTPYSSDARETYHEGWRNRTT
jgi:vanillate/3-O-methylgallate O-demethylase